MGGGSSNSGPLAASSRLAFLNSSLNLVSPRFSGAVFCCHFLSELYVSSAMCCQTKMTVPPRDAATAIFSLGVADSGWDRPLRRSSGSPRQQRASMKTCAFVSTNADAQVYFRHSLAR